MRPPRTPEAIALRALGMRAFGAPHRSAAGSYSSTTATLLLPLLTNAPPTRPPITYTLPFTTPAVAWLRGVGRGAHHGQLFGAGCDCSTAAARSCTPAGRSSA